MFSAMYTVRLNSLLECPETKAEIEKAMSTYPLYKSKSKQEYIPSYIPTREELNQKILDRYKYREIGFETPAMFIDNLRIALNEIMVKYNQLFFSADQDFSIIFNVDYTKTIEGKHDSEMNTSSSGMAVGSSTTHNETTSKNTSKENSSQNTTNDSNDKKVHSETPQNTLNITAKNIDSVPYADSVSWDKSNAKSDSYHKGEAEGTSANTGDDISATKQESRSLTGATSVGKDKTTERTFGNYGVVSSQDLVLKYRETIVNIEQMIINDERIKELFMLIY